MYYYIVFVSDVDIALSIKVAKNSSGTIYSTIYRIKQKPASIEKVCLETFKKKDTSARTESNTLHHSYRANPQTLNQLQTI